MYHPGVDALASPLVQMLALGVVIAAALAWANRRYQRCPHCRRWVPRAHRGWFRCKGCGRQYHRSVHLKR
jgi:tRNA(Ile2) C34 agmatinyltransferase TiaS